jgi:hypothetical protein
MSDIMPPHKALKNLPDYNWKAGDARIILVAPLVRERSR